MKTREILFWLIVGIMVLTTACKKDDESLEQIIPVTGITLDQTELTVTPGVSITLKANVIPKNATNKSVKWGSNSSAVEIDDSTGELRVLFFTEDVITVTAKTVDGGFTASVSMKVAGTPAIGVSLTEEDVVIGPGRSKTLLATVAPNDAANKNVTWESDNPEIAAIDETTGKITAHASGVAKITVTTDDGGFKATSYVRVPSLTNLLQNPSFEEDEGDNITLPYWNKLAQDWFDLYYEDPATDRFDASKTNRIAASDEFFEEGKNGAFFKPFITGNYVGRINANWTSGLYQTIPVTPGNEYWISMDLGRRVNNMDISINLNDKLKILSGDGTITYYELETAPFLDEATVGVSGTEVVIIDLSGHFIVPSGVTQVRFQFDQRSFPGPDQGPLTFFDNCEFREVPKEN